MYLFIRELKILATVGIDWKKNMLERINKQLNTL